MAELAIVVAIAVLLAIRQRNLRARATRRGHSIEYEAYLASPLWAARRRRWIRQAHGRCQNCRSRRRLTVHHVTYERLGHELDNDVVVLCWPCHEQLHP